MQKLNLIEKEYIAICDFVPSIIQGKADASKASLSSCKSFDVASYFVPYGKGARKVKAIFDIASYLSKKKHKDLPKKEYFTHVAVNNYKNNEIICTCSLTQGYRHQVRCHLSCSGFPIKGDALYNAKYIKDHQETIEKEVENHSYPLELKACKISFPSPYLSFSHNIQRLVFSLPLQDRKNL